MVILIDSREVVPETWSRKREGSITSKSEGFGSMKTGESGGSEEMCGCITCRKKTGNVVGRQVVERFESMKKSTELDTLVNRQPVTLLQKRGSMSAPGFCKNKLRTSILNFSKFKLVQGPKV